jgi:hypothetical protein
MDLSLGDPEIGDEPYLNEGEIRHHFVNRLGDAEMNQAPPSTTNRLVTTLKALFRDFTIPTMSLSALFWLC